MYRHGTTSFPVLPCQILHVPNIGHTHAALTAAAAPAYACMHADLEHKSLALEAPGDYRAELPVLLIILNSQDGTIL